jgi:hypothetical protein
MYTRAARESFFSLYSIKYNILSSKIYLKSYIFIKLFYYLYIEYFRFFNPYDPKKPKIVNNFPGEKHLAALE